MGLPPATLPRREDSGRDAAQIRNQDAVNRATSQTSEHSGL